MQLTPPGDVRCRVFDIQRFSIHDGPGIRTTVFLEGCPLRCAWCQNPEGLVAGRAPALPVSAILAEVLADRDFYAVSGGGLTLSGGEPLMHLGRAHALLAEAKRHALHTCVQTSGAVAEGHLAAVLALVDLFQFDLKHMDPERHRALTGADPARIHANAAYLVANGAAVAFRMPLVPGVNDAAVNLDAVAGFLSALGATALELVPYHRLYLDKYRDLGMTPRLMATEPPTRAALERAAEHLRQHAIDVTSDG